MGRRVDVDQLVGVSEIAERLGVKSPQRVRDWMQRYDDFPPPVARLSMGLVFSWADVKKWAKTRGRLP